MDIFVTRKGNEKDFEEIRSLIITCFGERKSRDVLLQQYIANGYMMVATINDKIVATCGIVPQVVYNGSKELLCACTHPDYRGFGIMHRLVKDALEELKDNQTVYCFATRVHYKEKANIHSVIENLGFKEQQRNFQKWTVENCREAFGYKCALRKNREDGICVCFEDMWVLV